MRADQTPGEATLRDYRERMLRVLVHIQQHLDDALGLDELARVACFSPYHFHRLFTGMVGESVKGHVRRLRLERAATQLKRSARPVTAIALDAGYDTPEAFTRAFKAGFGAAPSRFRSQRRVTAGVPAPSGVHFREDRRVSRFRTCTSGIQTLNVTIKSLPPLRVAFMRHVGPYSEVGRMWDRLLPLLAKDGWIAGDAQFIGICHDDPEVTPPAKLRYDACVTVDASFVPAGEVGVQVLPGGDYAMTTHIGPYARLGETYSVLFGQWLPQSGRDLRSSPCFEVYLNAPDSTDPEDLITDIYLPLEPSRAERRMGCSLEAKLQRSTFNAQRSTRRFAER
jgi:AraC family transcriptional regulator